MDRSKLREMGAAPGGIGERRPAVLGGEKRSFQNTAYLGPTKNGISTGINGPRVRLATRRAIPHLENIGAL